MTAAEFVDTLKALHGAGKLKAQDENREGAEGLWTVDGEEGAWAVYLRSDLDLDTDGGHAPGIRWESTHQDDTSLHWPDGSPVDSNAVPFVVIPGGWNRGIALGDVCHVEFGGNLVAAIVADIGPRRKIGEGSIALHRLLGFERVKAGRIIDVGIESGVRTLFYPGTGSGVCLTNDEIVQRAGRAWVKLTEGA